MADDALPSGLTLSALRRSAEINRDHTVEGTHPYGHLRSSADVVALLDRLRDAEDYASSLRRDLNRVEWVIAHCAGYLDPFDQDSAFVFVDDLRKGLAGEFDADIMAAVVDPDGPP